MYSNKILSGARAGILSQSRSTEQSQVRKDCTDVLQADNGQRMLHSVSNDCKLLGKRITLRSKLAGSTGSPGKCSPVFSALQNELNKSHAAELQLPECQAHGAQVLRKFVLSPLGFLPPQVWSNHSARFGALHVCTSTVSSHSLQRTAQHQWNLHSHLVTRVTRVVS